MTRTFFIGEPTAQQRKVYQTVLSAQEKAVKFLQDTLYRLPNAPLLAADVDRVARDYIISQGFPSLPHSLGHGIGLEVHEAPSLSPFSKEILTDDMVFSIEPGIYLQDEFGVRIEDLYTIQNNKLIQLTHAPNIE